jgi:hypothetical protein
MVGIENVVLGDGGRFNFAPKVCFEFRLETRKDDVGSILLTQSQRDVHVGYEI